MGRPLFPGPARSLVEQAIKAGWTVGAGPDPADPSMYRVSLGHRTDELLFKALWRLVPQPAKPGQLVWHLRFIERRHTPAAGPFQVGHVRLDEVHAEIKASVGAP